MQLANLGRYIVKKRLAFLIPIFLMILIGSIKIFFFDIAIVNGNSMYPTLHNGDFLIVRKSECPILIGDIVLLKLSSGDGMKEYAVKRVIATGGDTVKIDYGNNNVYINGQVIAEPYINYNQDDPMKQRDKQSITSFYVPDGYVFLMGDNRNYSTDSRNEEIGAISTEDVIGTVSIFIPAESG